MSADVTPSCGCVFKDLEIPCGNPKCPLCPPPVLAYAIHDHEADEYYRLTCGVSGWYGPFGSNTRLYGTKAQAQKTIDAGGHHVLYPGTRALRITVVGMRPA